MRFAKALAGFMLAALVACGAADEPEDWLPGDFPARFVEVRSCRSSSEHFPRIRIHAPADAAGPYDRGPYPFAPGTLIVKEEFSDGACSDLTGYTLMRKQTAGWDPRGGDWAYQRLDARGRVVKSEAGRDGTKRCVSCHALCGTRDFVCAD